MGMFAVERQQVKLASFNPRFEMHGKQGDGAAACDIKVEAKMMSTALDQFDVNLRKMLFTRNASVEGAVDLAEQGADLPNLRFPKLKAPFKFDADLIGATFVVHIPSGMRDDIRLETCKVNNFQFVPLEGGTVIFSWRVQGHADEKQAGRLCMLVQQMIDVSVIPPKAEDPASAGSDGKAF